MKCNSLVPPPARSEVVPIDPAPMEENWDPEPEEQDPATISDEAIIDLEGDNDPNDLGLIDPNAPDEILGRSRTAHVCLVRARHDVFMCETLTHQSPQVLD